MCFITSRNRLEKLGVYFNYTFYNIPVVIFRINTFRGDTMKGGRVRLISVVDAFLVVLFIFILVLISAVPVLFFAMYVSYFVSIAIKNVFSGHSIDGFAGFVLISSVMFFFYSLVCIPIKKKTKKRLNNYVLTAQLVCTVFWIPELFKDRSGLLGNLGLAIGSAFLFSFVLCLAHCVVYIISDKVLHKTSIKRDLVIIPISFCVGTLVNLGIWLLSLNVLFA